MILKEPPLNLSRTPARVFPSIPNNLVANPLRNLFSTGPGNGIAFDGPVVLEASPIPVQHGARVEQDTNGFPIAMQATGPYPEPPEVFGKARAAPETFANDMQLGFKQQASPV